VIEQATEGREGAASAAMQLTSALGIALGAGIGSAMVLLPARVDWPAEVGFVMGFAPMVGAALVTRVLARRLAGAGT
jgi:hypothetical protein